MEARIAALAAPDPAVRSSAAADIYDACEDDATVVPAMIRAEAIDRLVEGRGAHRRAECRSCDGSHLRYTGGS